MHFNAASHAWDSETTPVKYEAHRGNIPNTTNRSSCSSGVEILRRANYHTDTANPVHVLLPCMFSTNPWVNPMMMSS